MTDPKKNPRKQRRSFFWRRKPSPSGACEAGPSRLKRLNARRIRGIARRC